MDRRTGTALMESRGGKADLGRQEGQVNKVILQTEQIRGN